LDKRLVGNLLWAYLSTPAHDVSRRHEILNVISNVLGFTEEQRIQVRFSARDPRPFFPFFVSPFTDGMASMASHDNRLVWVLQRKDGFQASCPLVVEALLIPAHRAEDWSKM
jgi:hypothetical protein